MFPFPSFAKPSPPIYRALKRYHKIIEKNKKIPDMYRHIRIFEVFSVCHPSGESFDVSLKRTVYTCLLAQPRPEAIERILFENLKIDINESIDEAITLHLAGGNLFHDDRVMHHPAIIEYLSRYAPDEILSGKPYLMRMLGKRMGMSFGANRRADMSGRAAGNILSRVNRRTLAGGVIIFLVTISGAMWHFGLFSNNEQPTVKTGLPAPAIEAKVAFDQYLKETKKENTFENRKEFFEKSLYDEEKIPKDLKEFKKIQKTLDEGSGNRYFEISPKIHLEYFRQGGQQFNPHTRENQYLPHNIPVVLPKSAESDYAVTFEHMHSGTNQEPLIVPYGYSIVSISEGQVFTDGYDGYVFSGNKRASIQYGIKKLTGSNTPPGNSGSVQAIAFNINTETGSTVEIPPYAASETIRNKMYANNLLPISAKLKKEIATRLAENHNDRFKTLLFFGKQIHAKGYSRLFQDTFAEKAKSPEDLFDRLYSLNSLHCANANILFLSIARELGYGGFNVVGFGGTNNSVSPNSSLILGSFGHEWTELFIDGKTHIFDVTPNDSDYSYNLGNSKDSSDHTNQGSDIDLDSGGSSSKTGSGEKDTKGQISDKAKDDAGKDAQKKDAQKDIRKDAQKDEQKKDTSEKDKPEKTPPAEDEKEPDHGGPQEEELPLPPSAKELSDSEQIRTIFEHINTMDSFMDATKKMRDAKSDFLSRKIGKSLNRESFETIAIEALDREKWAWMAVFTSLDKDAIKYTIEPTGLMFDDPKTLEKVPKDIFIRFIDSLDKKQEQGKTSFLMIFGGRYEHEHEYLSMHDGYIQKIIVDKYLQDSSITSTFIRAIPIPVIIQKLGPDKTYEFLVSREVNPPLADMIPAFGEQKTMQYIKDRTLFSLVLKEAEKPAILHTIADIGRKLSDKKDFLSFVMKNDLQNEPEFLPMLTGNSDFFRLVLSKYPVAKKGSTPSILLDSAYHRAIDIHNASELDHAVSAGYFNLVLLRLYETGTDGLSEASRSLVYDQLKNAVLKDDQNCLKVLVFLLLVLPLLLLAGLSDRYIGFLTGVDFFWIFRILLYLACIGITWAMVSLNDPSAYLVIAPWVIAGFFVVGSLLFALPYAVIHVLSWEKRQDTLFNQNKTFTKDTIFTPDKLLAVALAIGMFLGSVSMLILARNGTASLSILTSLHLFLAPSPFSPFFQEVLFSVTLYTFVIILMIFLLLKKPALKRLLRETAERYYGDIKHCLLGKRNNNLSVSNLSYSTLKSIPMHQLSGIKTLLFVEYFSSTTTIPDFIRKLFQYVRLLPKLPEIMKSKDPELRILSDVYHMKVRMFDYAIALNRTVDASNRDASLKIVFSGGDTREFANFKKADDMTLGKNIDAKKSAMLGFAVEREYDAGDDQHVDILLNLKTVFGKEGSEGIASLIRKNIQIRNLFYQLDGKTYRYRNRIKSSRLTTVIEELVQKHEILVRLPDKYDITNERLPYMNYVYRYLSLMQTIIDGSKEAIHTAGLEKFGISRSHVIAIGFGK